MVHAATHVENKVSEVEITSCNGDKNMRKGKNVF